MLFHFHDHHRGRRTKSRRTQVPGRVPTSAKGQFHALAYSADIELQSHSAAFSNCKFAIIKETTVDRRLIRLHSHLCRLLVSLGQRTFPSPTRSMSLVCHDRSEYMWSGEKLQ